ncbi:MAG TPA: hypothetical protein VHZ06_07860 [Marmoricola sp.]|nr:hypothetical protein [Marmoricola sp.]
MDVACWSGPVVPVRRGTYTGGSSRLGSQPRSSMGLLAETFSG